MSVIYCTINEFDRQISIYLHNDTDEDKVIKQIDNNCIDDILPNLCEQYSINNLHLFGNAQFLNGIVEKIKIKEKTLYKNNNLNIEVN